MYDTLPAPAARMIALTAKAWGLAARADGPACTPGPAAPSGPQARSGPAHPSNRPDRRPPASGHVVRS
jgi:hypothetical protein